MSAISINVEPFDPETMEECTSPRNEKKSQEDKRSCVGCCGMSRRLLIIFIITACAALLLGAGLTVYFLIGPRPESPTTPPPTPPSTTSASPSVLPNVTTTATVTSPTAKPGKAPCIPIRWLEDVPLLASNKPTMRASLFTGQVSHRISIDICSRIDKVLFNNTVDFVQSLGFSKGALHFSFTDEEKSFDRIIRARNASVFTNLQSGQRKIWTGCYFKQTKKSWMHRCQKDPLTEYNNFCNKENWFKDLKELQAAAADEHDLIYIVKDYGNNDGCWKLYLEKDLKAIMGDNNDKTHGVASRLPFACITVDKSSTSGKEAIEKSKLDLCQIVN